MLKFAKNHKYSFEESWFLSVFHIFSMFNYSENSNKKVMNGSFSSYFMRCNVKKVCMLVSRMSMFAAILFFCYKHKERRRKGIFTIFLQWSVWRWYPYFYDLHVHLVYFPTNTPQINMTHKEVIIKYMWERYFCTVRPDQSVILTVQSSPGQSIDKMSTRRIFLFLHFKTVKIRKNNKCYPTSSRMRCSNAVYYVKHNRRRGGTMIIKNNSHVGRYELLEWMDGHSFLWKYLQTVWMESSI